MGGGGGGAGEGEAGVVETAAAGGEGEGGDEEGDEGGDGEGAVTREPRDSWREENQEERSEVLDDTVELKSIDDTDGLMMIRFSDRCVRNSLTAQSSI